MFLVKGDKITFKYDPQAQDLLLKITFRINKASRIGIVGKNGSGKSTLLKILLKELQPVSGHIQTPSNLKIGYLIQVPPKHESLTVNEYIWTVNPSLHAIKKILKDIGDNPNSHHWKLFTSYEEAGGYNFEVLIEKKLHEVGLDPSFLDRPLDSLSGGEKTKVGLLRILITDPDLLLMDEPTNNLDLESLQWLKSFLQSTNLPFVIVSHDRTLLSESATEIWEIKSGELTVFSGDYQFFQDMKARNYRSDLALYEQQQKKVRQLQTAADSKRVEANRMETFKESRSVKKNGGLCKRDEGSGSGRANPTKMMKSAKAVEKRLNLMIEREEAKKPLIEKKRKIKLPIPPPSHSKSILYVKDLGLCYGAISVFANISLQVDRGQRLAIVGPNGCGKSSLVKILSSQLNFNHGEFNWANTAILNVFFQDNVDLLENRTVLQSVWQPEIVEEHIVRTVLGSLGLGIDLVNAEIGKLSPGEKVKTSLARCILSGGNVLVLDEPTNHLEIPSRIILEEALVDYEGTVIFVSHDLLFIERVATQVFDLPKNKQFNCYSEWMAAR